MGESDCIFCKIAAGQIPAKIIYSDDDVISFMDINPVARGHVLVVPRNHAEFIWQMAPRDLAAVGMALGRVTGALKEALQPEGLNVLQNNGSVAGQLVAHVHFHLIPRFTGDEFHYKWPAHSVSDDELESLRELISSRVK